MTAWPSVALGDLCEIKIGRTPSRSRADFWGDGHPWLSIADMNQGRFLSHTKESITPLAVRDAGCKAVESGTVLLSFKLSIGKVGIAKRPLFTNEAIAGLPIVRPDLVNSGYLYWALRSMDVSVGFNRAAMGATLNKGALQRLQILLPPLSQQQPIAAVLDQADALRAKRQKSLDLEDDLVQSLFLDMFGDSHKNPYEFDVRPLGEWLLPGRPMTYGILMPGPDTEGGIPYVRVVDMRAGGIAVAGIRHTTPEISQRYRRSLLLSGDLLISIRGHVGRLALVPDELDGANITQDSARLAVPAESRRYVLAALRSSASQRWMAKRIKGVAVQGINLGDLRKLPLPVPPLEQQIAFAERWETQARAHGAQASAMKVLDGLFASLQHRAFAGRL